MHGSEVSSVQSGYRMKAVIQHLASGTRDPADIWTGESSEETKEAQKSSKETIHGMVDGPDDRLEITQKTQEHEA